MAQTKRDYYEVLGIDRTASPAELKRAYRALAMRLHPDRNGGDPEAEQQFKEVGEAYQVLSDPARRQRYDTFGQAGEGFAQAGSFNFQSAFDLFDPPPAPTVPAPEPSPAPRPTSARSARATARSNGCGSRCWARW